MEADKVCTKKPVKLPKIRSAKIYSPGSCIFSADGVK